MGRTTRPAQFEVNAASASAPLRRRGRRRGAPGELHVSFDLAAMEFAIRPCGTLSVGTFRSFSVKDRRHATVEVGCSAVGPSTTPGYIGE